MPTDLDLFFQAGSAYRSMNEMLAADAMARAEASYLRALNVGAVANSHPGANSGKHHPGNSDHE